MRSSLVPVLLLVGAATGCGLDFQKFDHLPDGGERPSASDGGAGAWAVGKFGGDPFYSVWASGPGGSFMWTTQPPLPTR